MSAWTNFINMFKGGDIREITTIFLYIRYQQNVDHEDFDKRTSTYVVLVLVIGVGGLL